MKKTRLALIFLGSACTLAAQAESLSQGDTVRDQTAYTLASMPVQETAEKFLREATAADVHGADHAGGTLRFYSGMLGNVNGTTDFWPSMHWLGSAGSDVSMAKLGYSWRNLKLEGAVFKSREAEQAGNSELMKLESTNKSLSYQLFTARKLSYQLAPNWSLRLSRSYHNNSPDQLRDPGIRRTTASATYYGMLNGSPWNTTLAWGRGGSQYSDISHTYLLESSLRMRDVHTVFARFERAGNDELFREEEASHHQSYSASKITLGYSQDVITHGPARLSIGGLASKRIVPVELANYYGGNSMSYMVFMRLQMRFASN